MRSMCLIACAPSCGQRTRKPFLLKKVSSFVMTVVFPAEGVPVISTKKGRGMRVLLYRIPQFNRFCNATHFSSNIDSVITHSSFEVRCQSTD